MPISKAIITSLSSIRRPLRRTRMASSPCPVVWPARFPTSFFKDQLDKARETVDWFKQTLGAENYYLELQNHGLPEQARVNRHLIEWSKEFGLKLVATNDVHYIEEGHSHAHDCLVCIGTQDLLSNPKRMSAGYPAQEFDLRSEEEMRARFAETPEAITNTLEMPANAIWNCR